MKQRRAPRGPVEHIVKVPLTAEERTELEQVAELDRATYSHVMRRALHEYHDERTKRRA